MKHIKLDDEAHRIAKTAAARAGVSMAEWIAEAVEHLDAHQGPTAPRVYGKQAHPV